MNNTTIENEKLAKRRRLKFGGLAVALTAFVLAATVVVNIIFSALATKFGIYVDMTAEQLFSISEVSLDLLNDYRGNSDLDISIIFCTDADTLDSNYMTRLVHNLAVEYEEEFDFVHVEYVDIINHPDALQKYLNTSVSSVATTSAIITNGETSKVFKYSSFYTYDSDSGDVFAFNGEYKITSTILQLAGDSPIAYFVTGHGENVSVDESGNVTGEMATLFDEAGFTVKAINLREETPDPAAKVMVIDSPKYDYYGADDSVNEIAKIDKFMSDEGNCGGLFVFMDSSTTSLPNLDEYLSEWGIKFENAQVRDYSHSYNVEGTEIKTEYVTEGTGASLTSTIRELDSYPDAVLSDCRPISFTFTDGEKLCNGSMRYTSAVLTTSSEKTAVATSLDGDGETEKGIFNLMTVSLDSRYLDNEPFYSYVVAVGSSSMADDKYIGSKSYANRDIIFNLMKNLAKRTVATDIDFKVFEDTELDCTTAEANVYTAVFTVGPALIAAVIGIFVYTRRRYL